MRKQQQNDLTPEFDMENRLEKQTEQSRIVPASLHAAVYGDYLNFRQKNTRRIAIRMLARKQSVVSKEDIEYIVSFEERNS